MNRFLAKNESIDFLLFLIWGPVWLAVRLYQDSRRPFYYHGCSNIEGA